ncbi:MAG: ATP-binding cassette domain-containing protein, partial [Bdellovibrionaceae bacterium]|nr:ATP-binding cassette domain-containing protein [Pseudobdellovibrionaceae bacterium]
MLAFNAVTKQQGSRILFSNASFQINPGDKIGLVGPNGAGKTTIFRLIMNEESTDVGNISKPERVRIGYFSQNIEDMQGRTVLEEVLSAGNLESIKSEIERLEVKLQDPNMDEDEMMRVVETYGELQQQFEAIGGYDLESRAKEILGGLGFANEDMLIDVGRFSGGWKMR